MTKQEKVKLEKLLVEANYVLSISNPKTQTYHFNSGYKWGIQRAMEECGFTFSELESHSSKVTESRTFGKD